MTTQHTPTPWTESEVIRHPQEVCRLLAERDELVAALRQIADFDATQAQSEYLQSIARAALAKVAA